MVQALYINYCNPTTVSHIFPILEIRKLKPENLRHKART